MINKDYKKERLNEIRNFLDLITDEIQNEGDEDD